MMLTDREGTALGRIWSRSSQCACSDGFAVRNHADRVVLECEVCCNTLTVAHCSLAGEVAWGASRLTGEPRVVGVDPGLERAVADLGAGRDELERVIRVQAGEIYALNQEVSHLETLTTGWKDRAYAVSSELDQLRNEIGITGNASATREATAYKPGRVVHCDNGSDDYY